MVELESSARGGSTGTSLRSRGPVSTPTLVGEAEIILINSWQAFGATNAAVLELVELQNPVSSLGSGTAAIEGSSSTLRRSLFSQDVLKNFVRCAVYRGLCCVLWDIHVFNAAVIRNEKQEVCR